jgi:hypothetical protein
MGYLEEEEDEGHGVEEVGVAGSLVDPQMPHDGSHHVEVHEAEADEDAALVFCKVQDE